MPRSRHLIALALAAAAFCAPRAAFATSYTPFLRLEIKDGTYATPPRATVVTSHAFTLYAYLTPVAGSTGTELATLLDTTFYIAAALKPKVTIGQDLGSFSFNNNVVRATADMVYGNPPFEPNTAPAATTSDLVRTDIYNTYFKEFRFNFNSNLRVTSCSGLGQNVNCANAHDNASTATGSMMDETELTAGSKPEMYYMASTVDTSTLNPDYQVHFDLYSESGNDGKTNRDLKYLAQVVKQRSRAR